MRPMTCSRFADLYRLEDAKRDLMHSAGPAMAPPAADLPWHRELKVRAERCRYRPMDFQSYSANCRRKIHWPTGRHLASLDAPFDAPPKLPRAPRWLPPVPLVNLPRYLSAQSRNIAGTAQSSCAGNA